MIRRLRLLSGLVMLAYVTMHLANHAVGLISLKAMEDVLWYIFRIWTNRPAQLLLYSSFLVHYALALYALWQRRTLRLRPSELSQTVLGFAIPLLLVRHVVATRISTAYTDVGYYAYLLWVYSSARPTMVSCRCWSWLLPGVTHDRPALLAEGGPGTRATGGLVVAVLVRSCPARHDRGGTPGHLLRPIPAGPARPLPCRQRDRARARAITEISVGFRGVVAAVLLARLVRRACRRRGLVRIGYPDGRVVEVTPGTSVLEASRLAGIPHASVCGGRGRCSTCRVRVRGEIRSIDSPAEDELRVLRRIGATSNVRLACQLRPRGAIEVTPLLPPFAHAADGRRRIDFAEGSEREIAIMFVDIRGFTALSEGRLPYDVVFVLNRYFAAIGFAVESAGGRVDKFIGDGVMALFGIERGAHTGCREALAAARLISARLDELNASLGAELDRPLRIGIGIHCGPAIVGEMGYGNAASITAIGDAVNTASRLESLTKNFACELVVSEETVSRAGLDLSAFPGREIEIRGKREMLAVRTLVSAAELPAAVLPTSIGRPRQASNGSLSPSIQTNSNR